MTVEELLQKKNLYYMPKERDFIITCLNPEHDDKHPSCHVDKITGIYHCFSCGYKGNLFDLFEVERNKLSEKVYSLLKEIKKIQAQTTGLKLPDGWIPFNKDHRDISAKTFRKFDAFTHDKYLPDRIIFPLKDIMGRIVVFQGRHLYTNDKREKYRNDPPGVKLPCFPAVVKPIEGSIIMVEGLFDMLNLHDKGLTNAIAIFGVDTLTRNWKEKLIDYKLQGVQKVYIMLDGDKAGRDASKKLKNTIKELFTVDEIELEDDVDPGSLSREDVKQLKDELYGKE